ncbi:MAG TPA: ATP-binding protein, partial [Nitrospira sp.]|nr:ATP-binding protein [Nitrospira sp.]
PPSKLPLMTLLKQARAFGLGVVLATQNPVDLDYKGLANTGTWFIGRLQTERDKARVLEGLDGASVSAGKTFDKSRMEQTLAGLGSRIFLMHNVHEDEPVVFETRWSLSYLRGPLTRSQIKTLMDPRRTESHASKAASQAGDSARQSTLESRPIVDPEVAQFFVPLRGRRPDDTRLVYVPMVLGAGQVRFVDGKNGIETTRDFHILAAVTDGAVALDWEQGAATRVSPADLEQTPEEEAQFAPVPLSATKAKSYDLWKKEFAGWLFRTQQLELFRSPTSNEVSRPGESERDFRVRLHQAGRERRDQHIESLRRKYAPKIAALQERVRRADQQREKQEVESRSSQVQAAISVGASILGAFLGRKTVSAANIGRATTAIRGAGRVLKESRDVNMAEENVAALKQQLADLEAQFGSERDALTAATDPLQEKLQSIPLRPTKANVTVRLVALAWTPHWRSAAGTMTPAWE